MAQDRTHPEDPDSPTPAPREVVALPWMQAARLRRTLEASCGTCPERDSPLRRELLCRCPVALAARLLRTSERLGDSPERLPPADRLSLQLQERVLATEPPPADWRLVDLAAERAEGLAHSGCRIQGCLTCRAVALVRALEAALACGELRRP